MSYMQHANVLMDLQRFKEFLDTFIIPLQSFEKNIPISKITARFITDSISNFYKKN